MGDIIKAFGGSPDPCVEILFEVVLSLLQSKKDHKSTEQKYPPRLCSSFLHGTVLFSPAMQVFREEPKNNTARHDKKNHEEKHDNDNNDD